MAGGCGFQLSARPKPPWTCLLSRSMGTSPQDAELPYAPGETAKLGLAEWSERDGLVYVPESYSPEEPSPIVLALHSDSSTADEALSSLLPFAEEHRLILAAPESRGATWDKNCEVFNEDVAFIDRALEVMFENYSVKPEKVGLAGFSGGASFALDLGAPNGPVFSHIMAFGPTEVEGPCYEDGPEIFLSYPNDTTHVCATCKASRPHYTTDTGTSTAAPSTHTSISGTSSTETSSRSNKAGGSSWGTHLLPHYLLPRLRSWGPRCTVHPFSLRTTCGGPRSPFGAPHHGHSMACPGCGIVPPYDVPRARQLELRGSGLTSLSPPGSSAGSSTPQGRGGRGPVVGRGPGHEGGVPHRAGGGYGDIHGVPEGEERGEVSVEEMFPREVVASAVDWFAKGKGSGPGFSYNNYEFWEKPGRRACKGCEGESVDLRFPGSKSSHV